MITPFRRVRSQDSLIRSLQDAVGFVLQDIVSKDILDGQILSDVELTTAPKYIDHGLGREIRGYIVVMKDADESVWDNQKINQTPQSNVLLIASGAVTVTLWVF